MFYSEIVISLTLNFSHLIEVSTFNQKLFPFDLFYYMYNVALISQTTFMNVLNKVCFFWTLKKY